MRGVGSAVPGLARRPYVRQAGLSAFAVAAAFGVGQLVPHISAGTAAIAALIAIRPTFHGSVQETFRQLIGVTFGAGVAYATMRAIGFSPLTVFLAVIACFLAARLLRLGQDAAGAIAVTAILVIGPTLMIAAVETRMLGVLVGSLIGVTVSLFVRPGQPHERALTDVVGKAHQVSELLTEIANTLSQNRGVVDVRRAADWLARSEGLGRDIVEIRTAAADAVLGAAWSPLFAQRDAQAVADQVAMTGATVGTVVNMCRELLVAAASDENLPHDVATSLSEVFLATADAIAEQSETARQTPAETLDLQGEPVRMAADSRRHAAAQIRRLDDTQPLLLGGSLLRDSKKIAEILSGR